MQSPVFSDDDAETPRTHIQNFLHNVETDPRYSLSSSRNLRTRTFVKTPDKKAKAKEKKSQLRLSTSLPSPGSLITPKTNLQHLLLGSDLAKTPYDRRVASSTFTRSSSNKSLPLHQASLDWGQKVSPSLIYNVSPSRTSGGFDGDSPSNVFKQPRRHRSFRIPDPPAKSAYNIHLGDAEVSGGVGDAQIEGTDDNAEVSGERSGNPSLSNATGDSPLKNSQRSLHNVGKSLLKDKARKAYELPTSSADEEDSFNDSNFLSASGSGSISRKSRSNLSLGKSKSTPVKTNTPQKRDGNSSRRSTDVSVTRATTRNDSHLEPTISASPKMKASQPSTPLRIHSQSETLEISPNVNTSEINSSKSRRVSARNKKSSEDEENLSNDSIFVSSSGLRGANRASRSNLSLGESKSTPVKTNTPGKRDGNSSRRSTDVSVTHATTRNDSYLEPTINASPKMKASQPSTPLRIHSQSETLEISPNVNSSSSKSRRVSVVNDSMTNNPRLSTVKRMATDDQDIEIEVEDQLFSMGTPFNSSLSRSKRRKTNSLNDLLNETNPSSSTPFKRSKSFFNSTKVQASMSDYLAPSKSTTSYNSGKLVAISDLSPIRPYDEQGHGLVTSDIEDPLGSIKEHHLQSSKSRRSHVSKTKSRIDDQPEDNEVEFQKKQTKRAAKKPKPTPTTVIPRKSVKFLAELYSSMKIDKEALDELEILTQHFMVNTLEAAECYSKHAGRKTITEADFVLMMKKQRLIKTKEDYYDLIRKFLPMEDRCALIPCFPSQSHRK